MKIGKIIAVASLAVAAGQSLVANAATATVCAGAAAKSEPFGAVGTPRTETGTDIFVKTGFSVQCSNNVHMAYNEVSSNSIGVVAVSAKGNQIAGGNSNGGAIGVLGTCGTGSTACGATDVTGKLDDVKVKGSSS